MSIDCVTSGRTVAVSRANVFLAPRKGSAAVRRGLARLIPSPQTSHQLYRFIMRTAVFATAVLAAAGSVAATPIQPEEHQEDKRQFLS